MDAISIYNKATLVWYYALILAISISNSIIFFIVRPLSNDIILIVSSSIAVGAATMVVVRQNKLKVLFKKNNVTFISILIGLVSWLLAEITWGYYELWLGIHNPFPTIADAFWLIGYVFFIYTVFRILTHFQYRVNESLPDTGTPKLNWYKNRIHITILLVSTALVIGIGLTYLSATIVFTGQNPLDVLNSNAFTSFAISVVYPLLDGVLLVPTVVILIGLRRTDPVFVHWSLICAFIIISIIGDIGFAYSEVILNTTQFTWVWDTFFNAAYICMIAALLWYYRYSIVTAIDIEQKEEKQNGK